MWIWVFDGCMIAWCGLNLLSLARGRRDESFMALHFYDAPVRNTLPSLGAELEFLDWHLDHDCGYLHSLRRTLKPYKNPVQRYTAATGKSPFIYEGSN